MTTDGVDVDPNALGEMLMPPPDFDPTVRMDEQNGVAPVALDPAQHYATVIQHLGIEIANKTIAIAQLEAKIGMALVAYDALSIDTWVRQVAHQPSMGGNGVRPGDMITLEGPLVVPPQEHEALSRFLAAVEALR